MARLGLERTRLKLGPVCIFPKLRESEDERIRKWIIDEIKATHDYDSPTSRKEVDDALAYLEKQKEQKSLPGVEDCGGVPGKDYIPVEWVDACERYGIWKIVKQKPAEWSENDEKILSDIDELLYDAPWSDKEIEEHRIWLKSLRPSWKPSEEQMKALEDAFRKNGSNEYRESINSLYQDLKKL